jgi:hypothetical protein
MDKVFTFRVLIDYEKDVFRDIQILSSQTFEDFHNAIQQAYNFDNKQMAAFYLSNDNWDKGDEIAMELMFENDTTSLMKDTVIASKIDEVGQKLVYVFDFMLMWCFFVELVKISPIDKKTKYPTCVHQFGIAPNQYEKELNFDDMSLNLEEDLNFDEDDEENDDIFKDFDDFDEYR